MPLMWRARHCCSVRHIAGNKLLLNHDLKGTIDVLPGSLRGGGSSGAMAKIIYLEQF